MSSREYYSKYMQPGEDDKGANDEGYYYMHCSSCNLKTEHESSGCIRCADNASKTRSKAKPHIDRFLANDPIDW